MFFVYILSLGTSHRCFYFIKGTNKCENGMLNIDQQEPEGFVAREGVVGYTWQSLWVTKDEFGSLIIRSDSGAVGIMLFIPVIGSEWNWYRFMNKNI